MIWFFIAFAGYVLQAIVYILDKKILTNAISKPVVYTFYSTIFLLPIFIAIPFGTESVQLVDMGVAMISGLTFGFGLWCMFLAVKQGEATHINPFIGATIAVATYALSYIFFQEVLTNIQLIGIVFVVFGSLLLSLEKSNKQIGLHKGFLWALSAGILFAVSHIAAKYMYMHYSFYTGIVYTRGSIGLVGLITLLYPSVRSSILFKNKKTKKRRLTTISMVVSNKILGIFSLLLIQYAIAIGSVVLVNAMAGLQYALMFVFIYMLTKFTPKLFKEVFTKREIFVEITALIFMVIGSVLFVL